MQLIDIITFKHLQYLVYITYSQGGIALSPLRA